MTDGFFGTELAKLDELADQGVIARERVQLTAAEYVGAAVATVCDLGAPGVEEHRDQRRAWPGPIRRQTKRKDPSSRVFDGGLQRQPRVRGGAARP